MNGRPVETTEAIYQHAVQYSIQVSVFQVNPGHLMIQVYLKFIVVCYMIVLN